MRVRARLIFLLLALIALVLVGRFATGNFSFLLTQFWFTAGFFLLVLLSLVDQPYFSKDANVFVNATTAWVSLLLVPGNAREAIWCSFLAWSTYLIISSYVLMWLRSRELAREGVRLQLVSRVNRQIGRPEALFSAFFLWGTIQQFGATATQIAPMFLFWAVFMILNLPAVAAALDQFFTFSTAEEAVNAGTLVHITSPRVAEVTLFSGLQTQITGRIVNINLRGRGNAAEAVIVDDRVVAGVRVGRLALTKTHDSWRDVGSPDGVEATISFSEATSADGQTAVSIVDAGSDIGKLVFHVNPDRALQAGEVLCVRKDAVTKAYYQIISAVVSQSALPDGNSMHTVRVTAGQLGVWDEQRCNSSQSLGWLPQENSFCKRPSPKSASTKFLKGIRPSARSLIPTFRSISRLRRP